MKNLIWEGVLSDHNGKDITLKLLEGCDIKKCIQMQMQWATHFLTLFDNFSKQNPNESIGSIIVKCNIEDSHWSWTNKATCLNTNEYLWFSIESDCDFECAMIVYHPKQSKLANDNIFYVDYLAVAPWNRDSAIQSAKLKGLGTLMLRTVGKYINESLSYRHGFSLHSLPKALPYYKKIGMNDFGADANKENLHYLEMEQIAARNFYNE